MITTTIFPGRYTQGFNVLSRLGQEISRYGKKPLMLADAFVLEHIYPDIKEELENQIPVIVETFGGECCDPEIDRLNKMVIEKDLDVIIGIGGGKTLDTSKAVAYYCKLPIIIIPTIASTDAACSALAVIYSSEGAFDRYLFLPKNPDLVLVDSKIIANAPVRFLVSGMGDALATWFEAQSCKIKFAGNMTGDVGSMTAYSLAKLCYETLLNYGLEAKTAAQAKVVTPALEHIIEANTLLSGLGFESGGLAAAHAIHNGLTSLEETHHYFHGEKVAIGTLASLFLTDKPRSVINQVYDFCEQIGLPTTLEEIGLKKVSLEKLRMVAEKSSVESETIHNELVPITVDGIVAALIAADEEGKRRKKNK